MMCTLSAPLRGSERRVSLRRQLPQPAAQREAEIEGDPSDGAMFHQETNRRRRGRQHPEDPIPQHAAVFRYLFADGRI